MAEFVDYISNMGLNDPNLTPHDGRNQRVEPGTYDWEITKAVFDQSKKGNRTLRVTANVITEDSPMKGRSLVGTYVISEDEFARRRMKALVEATGVQVDANGGLSKDAFVGTHFTADVVVDTFDDIDSKTGQPVTKDFTKWIGERPYEGSAPVQAAKPTAPASTATAPRRPAAPATNGNGARPRS
jgi:hypothetical protein